MKRKAKVKPKPKQVQVYDPKTKRWQKIDTRTCKVVARKNSPGAYANIPTRKTIPRVGKPAAKPRSTGRKIKYARPEKVVSMVYESKQGAIGGGTAKTPKTRAGRKQKKIPDVTPTNIKDLGRANVKTQLVRVKCGKLQPLPAVSTPAIAADILGDMAKNDREEVRVLYLNNSNKIIGVESAHIGSVNASICSPHEVFKTALLLNATSVMLAHNHPSGDPRPSHADLVNIRQFQDAGKVVEVKVLDSLIIGDGKYYSLQQEGDL